MRIAAVCSVAAIVIHVVVVSVRVVGFYRDVERCAEYLESLRPFKPPDMPGWEWDEYINVTVTVFYNVCIYDQYLESRKIVESVLALRESPPLEPKSKLRKVWAIVETKAHPKRGPYIQRMQRGFSDWRMRREIRSD